MESADNDDNDAAIHNEVFSSLIHQLTIHVIAVSCVYLMGPEGLEPPPPIFEPWGSCNISAPSIIDKRDNANTHKLPALEQRRKINNVFNSSLNADDIAAPYLISCV